MQSYSIEAIVISAVFSFLLSGLLGALFKDWLDRAKPNLFLVNFTFCGGDELLRVPDTLINLTAKSGWMPKLHRYESYSSLKERAQKTKRIVSRLKLSRETADEWLTRNKSWEQKKSGIASFDEIAQSPFFNDETLFAVLFGGARRAEIAIGPVPLADLEAAPNVTELVENKGKWYLYMSDRYVNVPIHQAHADVEKRSLKIIGESFARGSKTSIYHYMLETRRKMSDDTTKLNEAIESLERYLLPESFLSIKANIVNSGTKPLIVRPFGKLTFHNEELNNATIQLKIAHLSIETAKSSKLPTIVIGDSPSASEPPDSDGDEVQVNDPFPTAENSSYLFILPKSNLQIELRSVAPLGKAAERVLSMYNASVLRCSIKLLTVGGKAFEADKILFGKQITQSDAQLLKLVKSRDFEG